MNNDEISCRLCLEIKNPVLEIFGDILRKTNAQYKILKYVHLNILEDDNLSKYVCTNCMKKIEEFYKFCEQVDINQKILFEQLNGKNKKEEYDKTCNSKDLKKLSTNENTHSNDRETQENCLENSKRTRRKAQKYYNTSCSEDSASDSNDDETLENINSDCDTEPVLDSALDKNGIEYPKLLIKDAKLVVRGKKLIQLLSKFYKLNCEICSGIEDSKDFNKLSALFAHYSEVHASKGYILCCGNKMYKTRAMALHMAKHIQPDAFKCPECNKMMTCPRILRYHIQNHLPEEKRPLACPKCPRRFSYSSALTAHQVTHLPGEKRDSHVCDACGKTFSSAGKLSKHITSAHNNHCEQYVCHECGKQFSCKGNLSYHLTTHQQIHQAQCELCGKWLKNKLCLRKHMSQHSTIRHNCSKCNYSAVNRQCLQNHMRVQHSNDKPFSCQICGRDFKLKNTLINHMVQHTGVRRFACEFCNKQFASSGNYYSHRKKMHPNELADLNKKKEEEQRIMRETAFEKFGQS